MYKILYIYTAYPGVNNQKIANQNQGGGDKLQGLPPVACRRSFFLNVLRQRAVGENRHKKFYLNQLGGIGRKNTQFSSNADGVNCPTIKGINMECNFCHQNIGVHTHNIGGITYNDNPNMANHDIHTCHWCMSEHTPATHTHVNQCHYIDNK